MNTLVNRLAKKTGLKRKDIDALIKAIGYEMVEDLRLYHRFVYPNFGLFFCSSREGRLSVRISLEKEAYSRLNKLQEGEKPNEIILE